MAGKEKDWDDNTASPNPETLYTKEYCIGSFRHMSICLLDTEKQAILLLLFFWGGGKEAYRDNMLTKFDFF